MTDEAIKELHIIAQLHIFSLHGSVTKGIAKSCFNRWEHLVSEEADLFIILK